MSTMKESYLAKIIQGDRDVDAHGFALLMRILDLGMGDFAEIRVLEDTFE